MQGFAQEGDSVYLFSYFINNGEDGLHLAYSEDGLSWKALNENASYLKPEVGKDKLMRDPCIIQTPDG
ncbi:MAG: glycosyl hydrolase, partial [Bacteroidetes bacterium]